MPGVEPLPDGEAARFADRLRDAHVLLRGLQAPQQDRDRFVRRLIAIGDASKHDVGRAAARLAALLGELQGPPAGPEG